MPQYLTETAYRFCTKGEEYYSLFQQNRGRYQWIMNHWNDNGDDEAIYPQTFKAILMFMHKMKKPPASVTAVLDYVRANPDNVVEFEKATVIDTDLTTIFSNYESDPIDDDVLLAGLMNKARTGWVQLLYKNASNVAMGATQVKNRSGEKEAGVTTSIQYLRTSLADDYRDEAPAMAGILHENIPAIQTDLEKLGIEEATSGRFKLGLPHIDSNVVVGKQNLKFLGIIGMSGDGKTTLTNYIVYNWLKQGAHILYCSTEHSPEEIWRFMAFLHQSHPDYDFTVPGQNEWEQGRATPEDKFHMSKILVDIMDRKNLPGLLDCQTFRDWETIKDYLVMNHKKNKYDILVVDYLGRLSVPGDQKFRDKAVAEMVHDAQGLTRTFDANRGLIILSPIQVNREGHKRALAADPEKGEQRYNLNAISQVSEYQHDLDLCLSVYSDEEMREKNQIEIQQLKERKGKRSRPALMNLDPNSGAFEDGPLKNNKLWDRSVDDMVDATTLDIGHNADEWRR